jgi:preprotein translocase subunit YajC
VHTGPAALLAASNSGSGGYSLLFFAVIIVAMFWFMNRAQRRQRQRVADVQSRLLPGQEVLTGSGIYGRVVDTLDDRVRIEVAEGVVLTVARQAVVRAVDEPGIIDAPPADAPPADTAAGAPFAAGPGDSAYESGESRERTVAD